MLSQKIAHPFSKFTLKTDYQKKKKSLTNLFSYKYLPLLLFYNPLKEVDLTQMALQCLHNHFLHLQVWQLITILFFLYSSQRHLCNIYITYHIHTHKIQLNYFNFKYLPHSYFYDSIKLFPVHKLFKRQIITKLILCF